MTKASYKKSVIHQLVFVLRKYGKCLWLSACLFTVFLTDNNVLAQEYIFNHLVTKDGLESNFINTVWQDPKGFLWIGSKNGLQRYDGYHFVSPYYGNETRLPRLGVDQIIGDRKGRMWIRMQYKLFIFDPDNFKCTPVPIHLSGEFPFGKEMVLDQDKAGNVYVIIRYHNWLVYDEQKHAFEENKVPFKIPDGYHITRMFDDDKTGMLWVGTDNGLLAYNRNSKVIYSRQHNPVHHPLLERADFKNIVSLFVDSKRRFWIGIWNPEQLFYCYDERKQQFTTDSAGITQSSRGAYYELEDFTEISNNVIVVYGLKLLAMNDRGSFDSFIDDFPTNYSIEYGRVNAIFQDRENIVWIATDNGLYNTMAALNTTRHFVLSKKQVYTALTNMYELPNGDLWLGTWGRGIIKRSADLWNAGKDEINETAQRDFEYRMIWSFCKHTPSGDLWIGCQHGRLIYYSKHKATFLNPAPFENSTVRRIVEDQDGNLWLGINSGKLYKWRTGSTLQDTSFKEMINCRGLIERMYVDRKGSLWVSVYGKGILIINPATGKIIERYTADTKDIRLSSNFPNDVLQLNDSIYLIGSDVLNIIDIKNKTNKLVSEWNGMPVGSIITFQKDDDDNLWFSTENGIFKYIYAQDQIIKYTQWDGLITVANSEYVMESSLKLRNGNIAFIGNQNMFYFNPKQYESAGPPPDVTISSFRLFHQFIPVDSLLQQPRIVLNKDQNTISLEFASLSFRQLDKLEYYYKLQGADKEWIKAEHNLQANYTLLPPGKYTFMVRSQNAEGIFSQHITKVNIYIQPPFWRTAWFLSLVGIGISLAAYSLHRFRINKLLQVESVRSRLARDLHDDMGSTLSTIHILSNMAMRKLDSDKRSSKEYIAKISENSSRIMEAMDDIVWSINPLNDSMRKITARMKEFAGSVLESKEIDYHFSIEEPVKELSFNMEWRRELFLLFKESINNIAKYSQATKVTISMYLKNRHLMLRIEDDGIGFDTQKPLAENRGNGLKNMQKRAETMNGKFSITSCTGEGTCVEVKIPVT